MNRKKIICFQQHNNNENSNSEVFYLNISGNFLKCIRWIYALRFVACKISVDVRLFYFKLLDAKVSPFAFRATFAEMNWQVHSICSCVIRD